jgi:hypothetical protein
MELNFRITKNKVNLELLKILSNSVLFITPGQIFTIHMTVERSIIKIQVLTILFINNLSLLIIRLAIMDSFMVHKMH